MLYTRQQLTQTNYIDTHKATQRYLNKFINHRDEIRKLKWHEKDFFYEHLKILRNDNDQKVFDIYSIPEAKEYVLYYLTLTYAGDNQTINFNKKVADYEGEIPKKERERHSRIFYQLLSEWTMKLEEGKGQYLNVIRPLYNIKLKELQSLKKRKEINARTFILRVVYMRATFYHVYYIVRKYFDEMKVKSESCAICGINLYADIFSYAHILTRHYYPKMNCGVGGTLNENIPVLDIRNMPSSLLNLVKRYSEKKIITKETEYLLFIVDNVKYILWIKYGKIAILNNQVGMEIRSFYRCKEQQDIDKFAEKTIIRIDKHLSIVA